MSTAEEVSAFHCVGTFLAAICSEFTRFYHAVCSPFSNFIFLLNLHPSSNSTKRKEMLHSLQKSSARQSSIIQMQSTSMELTTFTTPTDLQLISPKTMPRMHSTMQTHALASNPISPKDILGKGQHCTRSRDTMIPSALTKKDWRSFPLIKV